MALVLLPCKLQIKVESRKEDKSTRNSIAGKGVRRIKDDTAVMRFKNGSGGSN